MSTPLSRAAFHAIEHMDVDRIEPLLHARTSQSRPRLAQCDQLDRHKSWGDARSDAGSLSLCLRADSFCSPKNEQGAGFLVVPPIKIGLLSQSLAAAIARHDGANATGLNARSDLIAKFKHTT
jgi:hypothetical protein